MFADFVFWPFQIPSALEGAKGVEGFMRSEADRRGVTFTVVGETSHAEDDEHRDHKTDPENRDDHGRSDSYKVVRAALDVPGAA